jgi:hypothetical protein
VGACRCDHGGVTRAPLPPGPPVVQLRVYEPLEAFSGAARTHWSRYARAGRGRPDVAYLERREAWRRVLAEPGDAPVPSPAGTDARVLVRDGVVHVCPLELRRQWAVAAGQARDLLPPIVTAVAMGPAPDTAPGVVTDGPRLRTLVAAWALPLEWLVLVRPEDRLDLTYVVALEQVRSRAVHTASAVRDSFGESVLTQRLEDVVRWVGGFDPRSYLEFDDEPVSRLVGRGEAVDDARMGLEAYRRLRRRDERLLMLARAS